MKTIENQFNAVNFKRKQWEQIERKIIQDDKI